MKFTALLQFSIITCFAFSCKNMGDQQDSGKQKNEHASNVSTGVSALPFVGKKQFETRPGIAGTGTPAWFVDIKQNGDVYFSFIQQNQADKVVGVEEPETIRGEFYAGKYQRYLRCYFPDTDAGLRFYEVTKDMVYEVNEQHQRITNEACCTSNNLDLGDRCPCEGELYE